MFAAVVTLTELGGCVGAPKNTLFPVDIERKRMLEEGTPSKYYQLFTSRRHLETIDSDLVTALDRLAGEETRRRGYCPNGYELMKGSPTHGKDGGSVAIIYGEGSDSVAIVVICKNYGVTH